MNILITGGTGFIGGSLTKSLANQGHTIYIVSRSKKADNGPIRYIQSPAADELFSPEVIQQVDAIINLAGHSIANGRWTKAVKDSILHSRVQMTKQIVESIKVNYENKNPIPKVLINASAVGYYGTHPSMTFDEGSNNGSGFLAKVCKEWEGQALLAENMLRVVRFRFGIVIGPNGGMLEQLVKPYRYGLGVCLGTGRQWLSWIYREDLVDVIAKAVEDIEFKGVYNLCSPNPVTIGELNHHLAKILKKKFIKIPGFLAKLVMGEMAEELLINGQKVLPKRLIEMDCKYKYSSVEDALRAALRLESLDL